MDKHKLIGKRIINLDGEHGEVSAIDEEGRIIVRYGGRATTYVGDVFEKGLLIFENEVDNQRIRLARVNKMRLEKIREMDMSLKDLNSLVGLTSIKQLVNDLVCQISTSNLREAFGLRCPEITKHMVFMGNPGTGKTTVARIIARIYRTLGILSKGHLVEVDRSMLVAGYQGQTAMKTKEVVSRAIGGVLFIDEAYSLCRDSDDDFGYEALDTLTKEIEDHRHDMVVIVAGYSHEMNKFLRANPGLASRFKTIIDFEDYSGEELYEILTNLVKEYDYSLSEEASEMVKNYFKKNSGFEGNGRGVRNLFEEMIRYQARRIHDAKNVTKKLLVTIEAQDLKGIRNMTC